MKLSENQIIIDKGKFTNNISMYELRSAYVEVPELAEMLGVEGKIPVIKVKQLTLDELLKAQSESMQTEGVLLEGLIKALDNKNSDEIAEVIQKTYGIGDKGVSIKTKLELKFCQYGIIEPEFSESDLLRISKLFPIVITKISNIVSQLTNLGGIKKNLES